MSGAVVAEHGLLLQLEQDVREIRRHIEASWGNPEYEAILATLKDLDSFRDLVRKANEMTTRVSNGKA